MVSENTNTANISDKCVLIVDDEADILLIIEQFLVDAGFRVLKSKSGEDALTMIKSNNIDLVLLDIAMPGIDGITTLREIKKIDPALMTVMITANGSPEKIVDAFNSGAYDYLVKPLDFTYLKESIISRFLS